MFLPCFHGNHDPFHRLRRWPGPLVLPRRWRLRRPPQHLPRLRLHRRLCQRLRLPPPTRALRRHWPIGHERDGGPWQNVGRPVRRGSGDDWTLRLRLDLSNAWRAYGGYQTSTGRTYSAGGGDIRDCPLIAGDGDRRSTSKSKSLKWIEAGETCGHIPLTGSGCAGHW